MHLRPRRRQTYVPRCVTNISPWRAPGWNKVLYYRRQPRAGQAGADRKTRFLCSGSRLTSILSETCDASARLGWAALGFAERFVQFLRPRVIFKRLTALIIFLPEGNFLPYYSLLVDPFWNNDLLVSRADVLQYHSRNRHDHNGLQSFAPSSPLTAQDSGAFGVCAVRRIYKTAPGCVAQIL